MEGKVSNRNFPSFLCVRNLKFDFVSDGRRFNKIHPRRIETKNEFPQRKKTFFSVFKNSVWTEI